MTGVSSLIGPTNSIIVRYLKDLGELHIVRRENKISYQLEKEILRGTFEPGDRLPSERQLATRFSASRSSIREAITQLETLGLLKTEPQSGTYVCDYQEEASYDLLMYLMENHEALEPKVFRSLMQVREVMEATALKTITTNDAPLRAELLERLTQVATAIRESSPSDLEALMELDYVFHRTLIEGADNIIFSTLFRTSKTVHRYYTKAFYSQPQACVEVVGQQQRLLDAIASGAAEVAHAALLELLAYGTEQVRRNLGL